MIIFEVLISVSIFFDLISQYSHISTSVRKLLLTIVLLAAGVISAFRKGIGTDYQHYIDIFVWSNSPGINRTYEEVGFLAFNRLLYAYGFTARAVFVFTAFLLIFSIYYFTVNIVPEKYWLFFAFMFLAGGTYFSSMNILRQYIGLSFVLIGFVFNLKKRYLFGIAFSMAALAFHRVSAVFFVVYILSWIVKRLKSNQWVIVTYAVALVLLLGGVGPIATLIVKIVPTWRGYVNVVNVSGIDWLAMLKSIIPNILILYSFLRRDNLNSKSTFANSTVKNLHDNTLVYVRTGSVIFGALAIAFPGNMVLTRITELFSVFLFAEVCHIVKNEPKKTKPLLWFVIVLYYMLLTVVTIFIMHGNGINGYEFSISI